MQEPVLQYKEPEWSKEPICDGWKLEIIKQGSVLDIFDLSKLGKSFLTVGRLPICDVSMEHASVSRYHAVLQFKSDKNELFVYDLGSAHGTFLNKEKIQSGTYIKLNPGFILKFGASTRSFIVHGPEPESRQENVKTPRKRYEENPIEFLSDWTEQCGVEANFSFSKKEDSFLCEIELPLDEPPFKIVGKGCEKTKPEARKAATLDALAQLDEQGMIEAPVEMIEREKSDDEDGNDEYFDRTATKKESSVETFDSLTKKLAHVVKSIAELEKDKNDFEEEDDLDAYMNSINKKIKEEDYDIKNLQIEELLKIAKPAGSFEFLTQTVKQIAENPTKRKIEGSDHQDDVISGAEKKQKSEPKTNKKEYSVTKPQSTLPSPQTIQIKSASPQTLSDQDEIGNKVIPHEEKWQPPADQKGDGRTHLNEKYGY
ncbi:hypothetical protein ROZALSC1DRAFT_26564 [Rozella allomycis CSF55]|uniref:Forkhead-associated (FHA) domain-containing protein n=1 Tax=Rozella allomycis (strain CSF55) TaxID=988480 RepID=A0A075AWH5_ROZAC|nr:Forkhead-associated (FHA) domain-containing protein [Rozella allomycis CSF55]RKP22051.1 hypothetical protein ROZALSC1DRAFT_26564 [Rozella allomycis CSF55]|eukprot:EPZ34660.1 Forkhead-associated (FHA) domain-containing protein [Rozella allomycis CSF55]